MDHRDEHPYSKFEDVEIERRLNTYLPGCLEFPEGNPLRHGLNEGPFPWQNGPRGEHGEHENGLLPTDLIYLAKRRIEFFNSPAYEGGHHRSRENSRAISFLEDAFGACVARTFGRVKRGVDGRREP